MHRIATYHERYYRPLELEAPSLDPEHFEEVTAGLPAWWRENNNAFYLERGLVPPAIQLACPPGSPLPTNSLIVCRSASLPRFFLWGEGSCIFIGANNHYNSSVFNCGAAAIHMGDAVRVVWNFAVNSRNGGMVHVREDCLVASNVQLVTDDMHAILDKRSGRRLNLFGGHVLIGRHVWLGLDVLVLGNTVLGDHTVVGARAVVKKRFPNHCVLAGVPAKVVRKGITWDERDVPPA